MLRNYVALPYEYLEEMEALSDEEFGRLCRGLLRYSMDGVPIQPEGNLRFFTRRVMGREDRFQENFADQQRKRAQAGKKGAEVRWNRDKGAIAEDSNAIASDSNAIFADGVPMATDGKHGQTKAEADTKTDTKTKTDTEADTNTNTNTLPACAGERHRPAAPAPDRAGRPTREQVFDFLREHGLSVDGERFWAYYEARDWLTQSGKPVDWRRRAEHWAETEWSSGGQVVPLRPTEAQRRAENRANLEEMRRALERMKASG